MNAYPNVERRDSAPSFMDRTNVRAVTVVHRQIAEERYTQDVELIADWMNVADDSREHSDYFGPISTAELVRVCFGGKTNEQQSKAALDELRKRYLDEYESRIAFDAARMA